MSWWSRSLLAVALFAAVAAQAGPAYAHDTLVSATPADGAAVPAPRRVELVFDDVVLDRYGQLAVTGPDGRRYDRGAPEVLDTTIAVPLAPLPVTGRYTVAYRIVSADGHPVSGEVRFTVTAPAPDASAPPAGPGSVAAPPPGSAGGTWAVLGGGAAVLGVLIAAATVVGRRRHRNEPAGS
jgi:copper resistance protein C